MNKWVGFKDGKQTDRVYGSRAAADYAISHRKIDFAMPLADLERNRAAAAQRKDGD